MRDKKQTFKTIRRLANKLFHRPEPIVMTTKAAQPLHLMTTESIRCWLAVVDRQVNSFDNCRDHSTTVEQAGAGGGRAEPNKD